MNFTLFALFFALGVSQAVAVKTAPLPLGLVARGHHHHHQTSSNITGKAISHRRARRSHPARLDQRGADVTVLLGQLQSLCGGLQSNQQDIHATRQEIANKPSSGKKYSNDLSNKLAAMRQQSGGATPIISNLNTALAPFGAGEGKLYYDKSNAFETLLKDFVDSNKYMLTDINYIIYTIPGLGPVLGPIVYDIKCVVEDLLNGVENSVDGLLDGEGLIGLKNLLSGFDFLSGLGLNLA